MNKEEKIEGYELVIAQLKGLLSEQNYTLSNLANSAALLRDLLPESIFVGYYLYDGERLILGPFQGSVSCVEIEMGKGVCGQAAAELETLIVDDVRAHKNYISCDSRALSEIVVPLIADGKLVGVLDLDAPSLAAYDEVDKKYLEAFAQLLSQLTDWKFFEIG